MIVAIEFVDLVNKRIVQAWADSRVLMVKRMVHNVLADKLGSSWYLSVSTCHQKLKNLLYLLNMVWRVFFELHEFSYQTENAREITFTSQDLVDVELLDFLLSGSL